MKLLLMTLVAFTSVSAFSQEDTTRLDTLSLKDLLNVKVTTASKNAIQLQLAPASVVVVTKEQIRLRGYQSLLDIMYDLPDFKVDDKIYPGSRNSITIRGIQGQQNFIILLDGIKISSPSADAMPIMETYPVHFAEQVEIMYGPAAALYGADAVSGIINIISRKISKKDFALNATVMGGTNGYSNQTIYLSKKINTSSSFVAAAQYTYDAQPDYSKVYSNDSSFNINSHKTGVFNSIYGTLIPLEPVTPKYEAPLQAYNIYAAVRLSRFTASIFTNFSKVPSSYSNNANNTVFNKDVFTAQSTTVASLNYKRTFDNVTSTTNFTSSTYKLHPSTNYRNMFTGMNRVYKYGKTDMIRMEEQIDYKASKKINLTAGVNYEKYNAIPQSADLASRVNEKDYIHANLPGTESFYMPKGLPAQFYFLQYNNAGGFIQLQSELSKKISITAGGRYDYNSRYGGAFNPRAGIVYQACKKTTIKAFYGSAFLAPATATSFAQWGSFETLDSGKTYHSYFLHLPNAGLRAIKVQSAEISLLHYLTNKLSVTADGYYSFQKGIIGYSDDSKSTRLYNNQYNGIPVDYVEVFTNNDRQRNWGGSLQINWKSNLGKLSVFSFASLSYTAGKVEHGLDEKDEQVKDRELEFIAPLMFRAGTDIKAGKFSLSPRLLIMGRQNIAGYSDTTGAIIKRQTLPGYALLNISFGYSISKKWNAFANVTNALNARYRAVGFNMDLTKTNTELLYGQPQDPIRIAAGIQLIL